MSHQRVNMSSESGGSSAPLMLAIETSQREASVALRDHLGNILEEQLSPKKRHDDDLMPAISRLFDRAGLKPGDLAASDSGSAGAVAVSIGPGGFTGLRIAVATAKMLAETLRVRLVGVPSALVAAEALELTTENTENTDQRLVEDVMIALACKGDSFWATRVHRAFERDSSSASWQIVGTPGIERASLFDVRSLRAIIADEFLPDAARRRAMEAGVPILEPLFTATHCLRVGARMFERGATIDPLALLPLYPREPEAVTLWAQRKEK